MALSPAHARPRLFSLPAGPALAGRLSHSVGVGAQRWPPAKRPDRRLYLFASFLLLLLLTACTVDTALGPSRADVVCTAAFVQRVVDGDTVVVIVDGAEARLRYIGVDTPESVDPRREVEPMGKEAAEQNRRLVEGKRVCLEKDVSETDRYDRLLRYVWLGETMANAELVRLGYAQARSYPPDVKYQPHLLELEREAREASRGLWALPASASPAGVR